MQNKYILMNFHQIIVFWRIWDPVLIVYVKELRPREIKSLSKVQISLISPTFISPLILELRTPYTHDWHCLKKCVQNPSDAKKCMPALFIHSQFSLFLF